MDPEAVTQSEVKQKEKNKYCILMHICGIQKNDIDDHICKAEVETQTQRTNGKTPQWPQDWKRAVFIPIPKKGNPKECSNYHTIALISHASKVMLKILQPRLQDYVNRELPNVQAGFRKARGTRDQIANIHWIIKKAREFQKNISISALLTMPKPLTVWITINCEKF